MVHKAEQEVAVKSRKVGDVLKEARLERNLTFEKIAEETKISVHYLKAIEEGDFASLPGYVYASGFIRTYANFLGLDAGIIYDMYQGETSCSKGKANFVAIDPEKERGLPHKKELIIAAGALLFIYAVWNIFSSSGGEHVTQKSDSLVVQQEVNKVEVQQDVTKAAAQRDLIKDKSEKSEIETSTSDNSAKKDSLVTVEGNAAVDREDITDREKAASSETEKGTGDVVKSSENSTVQAPVAKDKGKNSVSKTYGATGETRVVLVANSEVWIQVSDDDKVVLSRILKPGDKYCVPDDNDNLVLRVGNAVGLDVFVDGVKRAPLDRRNRVLRNVKIDAESLLSRD